MIDLSRYKVVYREKVLNAVALLGYDVKDYDTTMSELGTITVLAIDTDGTLISIQDESMMFQFIPIVTMGESRWWSAGGAK